MNANKPVFTQYENISEATPEMETEAARYLDGVEKDKASLVWRARELAKRLGINGLWAHRSTALYEIVQALEVEHNYNEID